MAEVFVTPESRDSGTGLLAVAVILILAVLGFIGYANGWFSMNPAAVTPSPSPNINITTPSPTPTPSSNINITTPTPSPTPTPNPTPTPTPTPTPSSG